MNRTGKFEVKSAVIFESKQTKRKMKMKMAPYLKAVLAYAKERSEPTPNSYPHVNKIDPNEHDPNKLTEIRKVKWEQTTISHALLF